MQIQDQFVYAKPTSTVLSMYGDRSYYERKYKDLGGQDIQVLAWEREGLRSRFKCRFRIRMDAPLPGFARRIFGDTVVATKQTSWDLEHGKGRVDLELRGVPGRISAEMSVADTPRGSVTDINWEILCRIPFVGGKLESLLAEDLALKTRRDALITGNILADY